MQVGSVGPRETCAPGQFAIFTCLRGVVRCGGREFKPGDFFLLPAQMENRELQPCDQTAEVLRTTMPGK